MDTQTSKEDGTPVDVTNETKHDTLDIPSTFDDSITALYRVLEYRFPQLYDSITSESSAERMRGVEQISDLMNTSNDPIRESKEYHSKLSVEDSTHMLNDTEVLSNTGDTIETEGPHNTVAHNAIDCQTKDVTKNSKEFSVMQASDKTKTLQSTRAPLGNHNSSFMKNIQSIDCDVYEFPRLVYYRNLFSMKGR